MSLYNVDEISVLIFEQSTVPERIEWMRQWFDLLNEDQFRALLDTQCSQQEIDNYIGLFKAESVMGRKYEALKQDIQRVTAENTDLRLTRFKRFNDEECWLYQGDGEDHLESLVCPVVINAAQLKEILDQNEMCNKVMLGKVQLSSAYGRFELSDDEKALILLGSGWERDRDNDSRWVKSAWMKEPTGGPNWYRQETLAGAWEQYLKDKMADTDNDN